MKHLKLLGVMMLLLAAAACNRDPKTVARKYVESGNRYLTSNKVKEASIMFRRAIQRDGLFGEAYYKLGLTELRLGKFGEAVNALRRAVELDANNEDAAAKLAEIYLLAYTQNPDPSKNPGAKMFIKEVEDLSAKLLKRNPNSFDGLRLRGFWHLTGNRRVEALADFEAAHKVKPEDPGIISVLAQNYMLDNRVAEAETLVKAFIGKKKDAYALYDLLYGIYIRTNRREEAEKILQAKTSANPKNGTFVLQMAGHYHAAGKMAERDAELAKISKNPTQFQHANALLGDFHFRIRDFDRAIQYYQTGIKEEPKEKTAYQKRMVEIFVNQNKRKEASDLVAEILKENATDEQALAIRAALTLASGDVSQVQSAISDLQAVVTSNPNNHLARFNLARALLAKGEVESARQQLNDVLKLRSDFLPAKIALAQVYVT